MKLEDQLCSLKQAESLKKLGVKQKSLYYYYRGLSTEDHGIQPAKYFEGTTSLNAAYSLFSVTELSQLLGSPLFVWTDDGIHWYSNENAEDTVAIIGMTMAEAMANDLICRLSIPEITVDKVNQRI